MKFLAPSDTTSATMRDGHAYSFTKPSNRIKAPAYGNASRTIGQTVDVTCQSCIEDFQNVRHGFASRLEDVAPTSSEQDWLIGKQQHAKSTIESLRAALDELELA